MFPYERVVQWLAGPVSGLVALGVTAVTHETISKSAALNVTTFALTAAASYAAHHKWLDNLGKWWQSPQVTAAVSAEQQPVFTNIDAGVSSPQSDDTPPPISAADLEQSRPDEVQSPGHPDYTPEEAANPPRPDKGAAEAQAEEAKGGPTQ